MGSRYFKLTHYRAMMTLDAIDRALDHPFRTFQNFGKPSVMPVRPVR